jgi:hypothetical protein
VEEAFGWVLVSSPLLVIVALVQRRISRPLAVLGIAILIGALTAILAALPLNGPGDAAVGRGWLVLYGIAASVIMVLIAFWSFMAGTAEAADEGDSESDSVAMFRATVGDETDS